MSPDSLREIERICHQALSLAPALRAAFLEKACSEDAIRREVESLLAAEADARELFSFAGQIPLFTEPERVEDTRPDPGPDPGQDPGQDLGADLGTAGPYRILEKLGEGGMGLVFRAHQSSPVARDVAIKIIRPGMASSQLVARFQLERQVLAIMDHPGIAHVYDAGATSRGLPYMVMELVAGRTLIKFCEEEALGLRQRVELMIPICLAIEHAHQKGIIHRDIKPSNVIVTVYDGKPVPKVIDFGIAKVIASVLGSAADGTQPGAMMGTFDYVSPEQAEPGAVDTDTRSDIYSLGALLYQVLTGSAPLEGLSLKHSSYAELLRRIREETPLPVSVRVKNLQAPELDWIVAKALDKDRERRYSTAGGMARDLRRFLDGEPVEAGPADVWYRVRKFAARRRWPLAAAALVAAMLVVALVSMAIALRQQQRANVNTQALRDVVRKMIVERPAQLARMPNRTTLRGELMRDAVGALEVLSHDTAPGDVVSQLELAKAYLAIGRAQGSFSSTGSEGDPAGSAQYVRRSTDIYRNLARLRPGDPEIRRGEMDALSTWVGLQYRLIQSAEGLRAAQQIEDAISRMSQELKEQIQANRYLSLALTERGAIQFLNGYSEDALALHRRAAAIFAGALPPSLAGDATMRDHWSSVQRELAISAWMFAGFGPEPLLAARRGVEAQAGCDTPICRMRRAQVQGTLGELEWAGGQRDQGIATLRESVKAFEALADEDPANAVYVHSGSTVRNYLALVLAKQGSGAEAVALAEKSLRLPGGADSKLFKGRERRLVHQITLGAALLGAKRFAAAETHLRDTLENNRDWKPNEDLRWNAMHLLAQALAAQGASGTAQGASGDELSVAAEAFQLIDAQTNRGVSASVIKAIAAFDYALAVAHLKASSPAQRQQAIAALDKRTVDLKTRYPELTGALLEAPPSAADLAGVRALLIRTPAAARK